MDSQETPLGRLGFLVVLIGIGLAVAFKSFWLAVVVAAAIGAYIAHVRAVLFVGRLRGAMDHNPLMGLQAKIQGVDVSTQIRFIFFQSIIGAAVFAVWIAVAAVVALFLR